MTIENLYITKIRVHGPIVDTGCQETSDQNAQGEFDHADFMMPDQHPNDHAEDWDKKEKIEIVQITVTFLLTDFGKKIS